MPSKPNRKKSGSKSKPKAPQPKADDISCAFTVSDGRKAGEVTVTMKTTTIQFNAVDVLNGSKGALSEILAAGSGAVAMAMSGVVSQWMKKKP